MFALTLHRPWPFAIFHLPPERAKPVENRDWPPPAGLVGERFAIHSGKVFDKHAAADIAERFELPPLEENPLATATGVAGTVELWGWVRATESLFPERRELIEFHGKVTREQAERLIRNEWFGGPYGWVLAKRRALATPVPCNGMQKIWRVDEHVRLEVARQETA